MQKLFEKIFGKRIGFRAIDPLGDGLAEEIVQEQLESQAISLEESDEQDIQRYWQNVSADIHSTGGVDFSE